MVAANLIPVSWFWLRCTLPVSLSTCMVIARLGLWVVFKPLLSLPNPECYTCDCVFNTCFRLYVSLPYSRALTFIFARALPVSLDSLVDDVKSDFDNAQNSTYLLTLTSL